MAITVCGRCVVVDVQHFHSGHCDVAYLWYLGGRMAGRCCQCGDAGAGEHDIGNEDQVGMISGKGLRNSSIIAIRN